MNFIIELSESNGCNAICIIVNKLIRERHYEVCITINEKTSAETTAEILIRNVFRHHELSTFITSNQDSQFTFVV